MRRNTRATEVGPPIGEARQGQIRVNGRQAAGLGSETLGTELPIPETTGSKRMSSTGIRTTAIKRERGRPPDKGVTAPELPTLRKFHVKSPLRGNHGTPVRAAASKI
ncbi:hypothetical protein B0T16DRAFT_420939 [Cercophora newfieldiana]|uniref:Uncharacterized protein n=1 Tax=Cercophora newfieldiana TaxID=92897 RepID=A0AA39XXE7_9PEZI|nr:hypothetical protein B0T16DRAFT_420939 [Cercophora newfieldiana]